MVKFRRIPTEVEDGIRRGPTRRPTGSGGSVDIGTRLRKLRTERGLTQRELGAPRYTHAYVSTIEAGRRHPSRTALEHFAERLGVGVDELETGRSPDLETRLRLDLQE